MKLADLMTPNVRSVSPDDSVHTAAKTMRDHDVGCLPVVKDKQVVGLLTDRDVTIRAVADARDPKSSTVREIMSTDPACLHDDDDADKAERLMKQRKFRRIIVLDRKDSPCGVVSLGDLATHNLARDDVAQVLESVSTGN
ncbi:MAG: CBS domain-containing protein [Planctomycetota bacterium]|nr:CBS domain-containing protein [Planctomycetota bacterium]